MDDLAARIGKSKSYVYGRMKLCALLWECRKMFYAEKLTPSTALLIARIPRELQLEAAKEITDGWRGPMTYKEALDHIHSEYTLRLKDAPFDARCSDLYPEAGPCTTCPKRTGNQQELFPDIKSADVCTDLKCFDVKKVNFARKQIGEAKAAGKKALTEEESKKHFRKRFLSSSTYIDMDDTIPQLEWKKPSEVFKNKADADVVLAIDEDGNLRKLMNKKDAKRWIKELAPKAKASDAVRSVQATERAKEAARKAAAMATIDRIIKAAAEEPGMSWAGPFLSLVFHRLSADATCFMVKRRDPDIKRDQAAAYVKDLIKNHETPNSQLMLALEMMLCEALYYEWSNDDEVKNLCRIYKINRGAIARKAKKDMTKKPAAKKGKPDAVRKPKTKKKKA